MVSYFLKTEAVKGVVDEAKANITDLKRLVQISTVQYLRLFFERNRFNIAVYTRNRNYKICS